MSLFRDSESYIHQALSRFQSLNETKTFSWLTHFDLEFEFFFYENDSKDSTRSVLQNWVNRYSENAKLFYEDLCTPKFGSVPDAERLVLLSGYRNKLKSLAGKLNSTFCVLVDSDVEFTPDHIEMLCREIARNDWSMVTANSRAVPGDVYYDAFTLKDKLLNNGLYHADCPMVLKEDRDRWKNGEAVPVVSAFGGLAVVRSSFFNKVKWSTTGNCEHVNLCLELGRFGQVCVLPTCNPTIKIDESQIYFPTDSFKKRTNQILTEFNSRFERSLETKGPSETIVL